MLIGLFSQYLFGIAIFVTSVFLVMLVLVQRGRGGGLVGALGGPGGQSALGTKAGDIFTRITIVVAAIWIFLCASAVRVLNPSDSNPLTGLDEVADVRSGQAGSAPGASAPGTAAPGTAAPSTTVPGATAPSSAAPGAIDRTPPATSPAPGAPATPPIDAAPENSLRSTPPAENTPAPENAPAPQSTPATENTPPAEGEADKAEATPEPNDEADASEPDSQ